MESKNAITIVLVTVDMCGMYGMYKLYVHYLEHRHQMYVKV